MTNIDIVVYKIEAEKFSGGLLCIFEYANGLVARGHEVTVIPLLPSEEPKWFQPNFRIDFVGNRKLSSLGDAAAAFSRYLVKRTRVQKNKVKDELTLLLGRLARYGGYNYMHALAIENFRSRRSTADITLATSFETAFPVAAHGAGRKFYFMQHYEPYFAIDSDRPEAARLDAELSYSLPLVLIANSSWLAGTIKEKHLVSKVMVNCNAIDHEQFYPEPDCPRGRPFTIISYGGRNATWKGFRDAAEAIRLARHRIPDLRWQVFGDALLPPNNDLATYDHLGFITGAQLRRAYSNADVTLCPSWYESFPLFPLEAMACGSAVVTTPFGTEDYARNDENALVVPARDPQRMADSIVRLYESQELRDCLTRNARASALEYNWSRAVDGLERKLLAADEIRA